MRVPIDRGVNGSNPVGVKVFAPIKLDIGYRPLIKLPRLSFKSNSSVGLCLIAQSWHLSGCQSFGTFCSIIFRVFLMSG